MYKKIVFLYTINEQREIFLSTNYKNIQTMEMLGINVTINVKDLYTETTKHYREKLKI